MTYQGSCHCGAIRFRIPPYALGKDPQGNEMAAINVRCLEGIDLGALPRVPFDGRSR